jgi:hypothetical protein
MCLLSIENFEKKINIYGNVKTHTAHKNNHSDVTKSLTTQYINALQKNNTQKYDQI